MGPILPLLSESPPKDALDSALTPLSGDILAMDWGLILDKVKVGECTV